MRNTWRVLLSLTLGGCAAGSKPSQTSPRQLVPLKVAAQDGGTKESDLPEEGSLRPGHDQEQVRSVIVANRGDIRECYDRVLEHAPHLRGKVTVRFIINADGSVREPSAIQNTVGDEGLAQCIASKMTAWRFPPVAYGGAVVVTYPFLFKPLQEPDAGVPDAGT